MYSQTKGEMPSDGETPVLVRINRILSWQASGRTFPVVAGAEDPPGDGKSGDDDHKDDPPGKKPDGSGDGSGDDGEFNKDRALATIRKLRENEKTTKAQLKELDDLRKKVKEHEDAQKSEAERLQARVKELEDSNAAKDRTLVETRNRQALERAATKAGAADPDDVFRLLDPDDFETDGDGKLTNADELVKKLLKEKPYLVGKSNGREGVPGTPKPGEQPGHEERVKENRQKLVETGNYSPL